MSTIPPPLDTYPLSEGPEIMYVGRYDMPDAMYNRYKNDCAVLQATAPIDTPDTEGLPALPTLRRPVCAQKLTKEMLFGNQPRLAMVDMNASNQHMPILSEEIVNGFEQSVPPPQSIQAVRARTQNMNRSSWNKLLDNHLFVCDMDNISAKECATKLHGYMFGS